MQCKKVGEMNPPVGVFYETENIYTLDDKSEMALSFIATLAQEESHTKSEIMNAYVQMRFKRGIILTPVWCMIYDDLEYVEEADIFANQMKNVKALQPCEIFKANCEAGNDKALIIKSLVESYDLKINPGATPGTIAAISTFSSNILNGVARLIMAYGDKLKDEVFKEKVGNMSIKELTRTAKERRAGALGYAEIMLIAYNKRNKAPLIWQSLYSGSGKVISLEKQGGEIAENRVRKKNCAN